MMVLIYFKWGSKQFAPYIQASAFSFLHKTYHSNETGVTLIAVLDSEAASTLLSWTLVS